MVSTDDKPFKTDVSRKVTFPERRFPKRRCHDMSRRRRHDGLLRRCERHVAAVAVDAALVVVA